MEHLVIVTPRDGAFAAYLSAFSQVYKKTAESVNFAYFTYVGFIDPKQKVLQILSVRNFKEFSLDKETNYFRFKVHVE